MAELVRLQREENQAQKNRDEQPPAQLLAFVLLERPVGEGDGAAAGDQDNGVDEGDTERGNGLERSTDVGRSVRRPESLRSRATGRVRS